MPEVSRTSESGNGEVDSRRGLWNAIRRFFDEESGLSLRSRIEQAIDGHEDENAGSLNGAAEGDFSPAELMMLRNLLHFSKNDADDVAIPRGEIIAISDDASWEDMVALFANHGHSRLPVYRETLDEVVGMMHIKDVFPYLAKGAPPAGGWTTLMRQPLYVPQARRALDVLADMRSKRIHLAIVVDEFSGTDGIITIEDLVEEIVGSIEDEHDEAPVELITANGDGTWDCDARAELDDVAKTLGDARIAEVAEAVDTLGGLAFVLAGQFPQPGSVLTHSSGWRLEILEGNDTHVTRLRLHQPELDDQISEETGE